MASVRDIHSTFTNSLEESRSLFMYCRTPLGPHSSAGVESAFLDAFKAWEIFLEDLIFAYLRGEQDITGSHVQTTFTLHSSELDTFTRIVTGGRVGYIGWANPDSHVKPRLKTFFDPSLEEKLNGGLPELREMLKCRNAIAHSSSRTFREMNSLWTEKTGASKTPIRSADILMFQAVSQPPLTWFERYLQVLETLSQELIEV